MNNLPDVLQLLVSAILMIGFVLVVNAPQFLAEWAHDKQNQAEREAIQQAEIERKLAIAEAAIAARARGDLRPPGRLRPLIPSLRACYLTSGHPLMCPLQPWASSR